VAIFSVRARVAKVTLDGEPKTQISVLGLYTNGGNHMRTKIIALTLLASTAFATAALAQQNAAPSSGDWRASKLIGLNVYNEQNDKLGDIEEILLDKTGKVDGVVIGVGGFLGMGEHEIKVSMDKLRFVNDAPRGAATTASSTRPVNNTSTAANTDTKAVANSNAASTDKDHKWYPDHAVLGNATKDQLKAMPQFKFD
jgi:sporulation protein YlmC with PRC-barrel domain